MTDGAADSLGGLNGKTPPEDKEPRTFPTNNSDVYHFHPLAFIEHMKKISSGMPPWMEIAIDKAIMAGGAEESEEPLYSFAKQCLEFGGSSYTPDDDDKGQWCGAFVSWCVNEAGFKTPDQKWRRLNSQEFIKLAEEGQCYKKIVEPVVGAIVILSNYYYSDNGKTPTSGHVSLLYGVDKNEDLICLGGNQGSHLKFSTYYRWKGRKLIDKKGNVIGEQKFNCFLIPIKYNTSIENLDIPKFNCDEINKKYGINIKKSGTNESTF